MNRKGFTLVELLAVIVILAVILVIAVPKITDVISNTKKSSIESTLKMIATSAEKEYATRELLATLDQENNPIECSDVVTLSSADYDTCDITFNNGIASVSLVGKGKFEGYTLVGTKDGITTTYSEPILNGAYPRLDEGMIPVTIAPNGDVTSADPSTTWYKYEDKIWANAVLVKKDDGVHTREYYKTHYEEIDPSDILAYFVWIPRYRYQLFNAEGADGTTPISIPITFESADTTKSNGTTDGAWLTHPGFTYDGEPLNGIWVGKFETTPTAGSTCSNIPSVDNCKNENPTILPDVQSLRYQDVSTQFATSKKFKSEYYGLNSESRMMKNSDWGAVAYLTNSIYGRCVQSSCEEVYINNSENYYSGRSAGEVGSLGGITSPYGTYSYEGYLMTDDEKGDSINISKIASTTGNITGIYDMIGGASEYVMGVLVGTNSKGRSGYDAQNNSGFNGQLYAGNKTDGENFPNPKYYKLYNETDWEKNEDYLGEALGETRGWYGDNQAFANISNPWIRRGGKYGDGATTGLFCFDHPFGRANVSVSFHVVVISS